MKANEVYSKTMKFVWLKLALGGCVIAFSALLALILLGITTLSGNADLFPMMLFVWCILSAACLGIAQHFVGYILKAGHIAVVTSIVTNGKVPENQLAYGKEMVTRRFPTTAAYFAVDRLVAGAVKQINSGLDIVGNLLGKIPGMDSVVSFAQSFVNIALGNVDECCLAYTFYKEDQSAFKSAADGVVIYFQNWKTVLKAALKVTFITFIISGLAWVILMVVTVGILAATGMPGFGAFFISMIITLLTVIVVKSAFMDSYAMVCMVCSYMGTAPSTELTFDLYDKLCKLSSKFKNLFQHSQEGTAQI